MASQEGPLKYLKTIEAKQKAQRKIDIQNNCKEVIAKIERERKRKREEEAGRPEEEEKKKEGGKKEGEQIRLIAVKQEQQESD